MSISSQNFAEAQAASTVSSYDYETAKAIAETMQVNSPLVRRMFIAANTEIFGDFVLPGFSEMECRCVDMKPIIRSFIIDQLLDAKDYDEIHAVKVSVIDNDDYLRVVFTTIQGERLTLHLPCSPLRLLFWRKFFNAHDYTLLNGYIAWQPYQLGWTEQGWKEKIQEQLDECGPDYIRVVDRQNVNDITCVNLIDKQPIRLFDFLNELLDDLDTFFSSSHREIELKELRNDGFELKNGTFCLVEKI